ncbi:predicted protein [Histoplasma capsulatum var. duboisii H88]|uniref:Predicted protein n=2 Tax=Ajellomyces capsulatus TaxID=5037 RepID=F0UVG8_AJEC8|nr:predicted protein [Histoplasma capsulatum H143]EGC49895.1 predicted protein [Histoplasma capsulatum var. duboisii H88]
MTLTESINYAKVEFKNAFDGLLRGDSTGETPEKRATSLVRLEDVRMHACGPPVEQFNPHGGMGAQPAHYWLLRSSSNKGYSCIIFGAAVSKDSYSPQIAAPPPLCQE